MASNKQSAVSLIDYCAQAVGNTQTFGYLTSSIYDTAWVAILRKPNSLGEDILFPECYRYILTQQHAGSGWENSPESEIDGIMCTLGGLLALLTNSEVPQDGISSDEIATRVKDAVEFLNTKLQTWDVASCDHVGFEIIIPSMLERLEQKGLSFKFPGQSLLADLNQSKLAKIHPAVWSGKIQTTITHSLEAFLGKADFSGLRDQRIWGGMGSSPSSTAAYLMWSPEWDEEAGEYLRTVLSSRPPGEVGGVPGMFPTTGFEVFWIASTLLEDGFDSSSLVGIDAVLTMIEEYYASLDGLASGFSKWSVPDADDTSKSIMLCNLLGKPTRVDKLVNTFEGKNHFLTYMMERHPSVTTNCNVLSALLVSPEPGKYVPQMEKCAKFLCASWMEADIPFQDKWNTSEFYPIMLLSQALCRLINAWDKGLLSDLSEDLVAQDISLVLFQVLLQTLQKQNANGSWGHIPSKEITAYAIIALGNLASLPFSASLTDVIRCAIENGRSFINSSGLAPDVEYVWIAKTDYSPINISKAYMLAALETQWPKYSLGNSLSNLLNLPTGVIKKYTHMFSSFPTLKGLPRWRIEGAVTEACLFFGKLRDAKLGIFDRASLKGDEYFEFIAVTLACSNNLQGAFLKTNILFSMMSFILHVYEIDEYFEHVIGIAYHQNLGEIKQLVASLLERQPCKKRKFECRDSSNGEENGTAAAKEPNGFPTNGSAAALLASGDEDSHVQEQPRTNGHGPNKPPVLNGGINGAHVPQNLPQTVVEEISQNIKSFIHAVLENPAIQKADAADRSILKHELRRSLQAHITQLQDSRSYYQSIEAGAEWHVPCGSYHEWVRTSGAAHSCSPLSLAFFRCLIPKSLAGHRVSALEQYMVQDLWMHLANRARMENDRSSVRRDRREKNLNSLDFPEFGRINGEDDATQSIEQLTHIIEYEKKWCKVGFEALESASGEGRKSSQLNSLKFYYFLEDLYNDVYVLKDISSGRKDR